MAETKSLDPIATAAVQRHVDNAIAELPARADRKRFAESVREAADIYAKQTRAPTDNKLRAEIAALYRAAKRKRLGHVAELFETLSPEARRLLRNRASRLSFKLPASQWPHDTAQQQQACEVVLKLCQRGGKYVEGRQRPSGKRSRAWRPLLVGPKPRRNFPKRDAELNFIMWLQVAWLEATGQWPSRAANAARPGPFARMVRKCLELVGAGHADAVGLINELNRRRIESRPGKHQN
jgi:hypothetical protein